MRGKWLLIGGTAVLVALGAGVFLFLRTQRPSAPAAKSGAPGTIFSGTEVSLPGTIEAQEVVAVPVPVDGRIEALLVNAGQSVSEGQLLAQVRNTGLESQQEASSAELTRLRSRVEGLESRLLEAQLETSRARERAGQARDEMGGAEKALQRQQMLFSKGAAGKQAVEKAQTDFEAASKRYDGLNELSRLTQERLDGLTKECDAARQALAQKTKEHEDAVAQVASGDVASPVDGLVVARHGQVGDEVSVETKDFFQIAVNWSQLKVVLQPEPPILARIRKGQAAVIQVAEVPEGIEGKVSQVREGQVWVEFTSPSSEVKPGMTAQVRIKLT